MLDALRVERAGEHDDGHAYDLLAIQRCRSRGTIRGRPDAAEGSVTSPTISSPLTLASWVDPVASA